MHIFLLLLLVAHFTTWFIQIHSWTENGQTHLSVYFSSIICLDVFVHLQSNCEFVWIMLWNEREAEALKFLLLSINQFSRTCAVFLKIEHVTFNIKHKSFVGLQRRISPKELIINMMKNMWEIFRILDHVSLPLFYSIYFRR